MKKFIAVLLVCMLVMATLTACGGDNKDGGNGSGQGENSGNTQTPAESGKLIETGGSLTYEVAGGSVNTNAKVDVGSLYVSDSMLDAGISRPGSLARLAEKFEKAAYGGTLNIAYIGGSIAAGEGASSYETSYAALTTAWFKETFPTATINEINIGAKNCDSYVAAHRIADEVLPSNPDIIIIDTAAEDNGAVSREGFESMVRVFLSAASNPAVIPLVTTNSTYQDDGDSQAAVAFKIDLPVINYASVLESNITNGTWAWTDIATAEETLNPADNGHAFIAYLLTTYFSRVMDGMAESSYKEFTLTDSTSTQTRYMDASFTTPDQVPHDGEDNIFNELPNVGTNTFVTRGMGTTSGKEATFTVTGKCIGMLYWRSIDGNCGEFDVYVDGELLQTLNADLSADETALYNYAESIELGKFSDSSAHEVKIVKHPDSTVEGDDFFVCGFLISK